MPDDTDDDGVEHEMGATSDTGEDETGPADAPDADADREDSPGGTVSHHGLVLDEIRENARGRDAQHLDDEYLVFENDGDDRIDLTGWTVTNEAGDAYSFPDGFALEPGEQVTLHSGSGRDAEGDLHWEAKRPVWPNTGATVLVRDDEGRQVLHESY